jgi:DNA replication and repair protein RecF
MNFIAGKNGVGKTNILEAISVVSNLRSFRNNADIELIQWGYDSYFCSASVLDNEEMMFEVGYTINNEKIKKRVKIDNVEQHRALDYYGRLLTVIISPDDLSIITGGPEIRRRYFDSVISKGDKDYFQKLIEFRRILSSRNAVLKGLRNSPGGNDGQLTVWNEMFAEAASLIVRKREKFISEFASCFSEVYRDIFGEVNAPVLTYTFFPSSSVADAIYRELDKRKERDVIQGSTTIGPQRDDYRLTDSKGHLFQNYSSQGQKRTAAVSLKISEILYIEKVRKKKTVILVDDIFSELDFDRRKSLLSILQRGNQVIFTMIDDTPQGFGVCDNSVVYRIEEAGVVNKL